MPDVRSPLRIERLEPTRGLRLVRQAPPAGAATFSASYVGPGGWAYDPAGSEGTARLVNQLSPIAVGPYDRRELARRLDRLGATLRRQCAPESAELTIWGPADEWHELLRILGLAVQQPRFAVDDLAHARRQMLERQLREGTQPDARAEREFLRRIFPAGHPYRETGLGTARSVRRLSRGELARFHRTHYTGEGGLLAVTGPARAADVVGAVRRSFQPFASDRTPAPPRARRRPAAGGVRTVEMAGRSQVEVRIGGPSISRADPSYPAAFLANEILGGRSLLGRLFQQVRERAGLAYHASSDLEAMRWGGYWVAQAGTGAERWRKLLPILERELRRIRTEPPSPSELKLIRESAIGEIVLSLESTSEAHELAVDAAYYDLPEDHWLTWPAALRSVRPTDVRDAAALALGGDGSSTVVAGPLSPPT